MTRFALILAVWLLAILTIGLLADENRAPNAGLPLVKSSAAQGDMARANTLLSPCPLAPQNLPKVIIEERA